MKKTALVLTLTLLFSSLTVFASSFSDVPESYWGYEVIEEMKADGVLDGYEDGTFRPEGLLTNAECAKILCVIAKLPEESAKYDDVARDAWYFEYVRDCGKYIKTESEFLPNEIITREEFSVAVAKVLGLEEENEELSFSDKGTITEKDYVASAVKRGFISGFEDGTFRAKEGLTRAQCCSMLSRAFNGEETTEEPMEEPSDEPSKESEWKVTKLSNTKLEDFARNVITDEKGKIYLIEKDEDEILFEIDLPEGETKKETAIELRKFLLHEGDDDETVGYTDFQPLSLFHDNYNDKVLLFGCFNKYTDENGEEFSVNKFVTIDFTIRVESYTEFENGKVQYNAKNMPKLLNIFREKYAMVFDGAHTVYRFKSDNGERQGELFTGNENTYREFLSESQDNITATNGDMMYAIDKDWNYVKINMYNCEFEKTDVKLDADLSGTYKSKFWLWNRESGEIFTMTPSGKQEKVHENVFIPDNCGINLSKLNEHMLVISDSKFLLFDGSSLFIMEKK